MVAAEYVALCGFKNGGDRKSKAENQLLIPKEEIALQLERVLYKYVQNLDG